MKINESILTELQRNMGLESSETVWINYLRELLKDIDKDPAAWVAVTAERCMFETLLTKSGRAFGQNLDLIGNILRSSLNVDCDVESRLKIFTALSDAFDEKDKLFDDAKDLSAFLRQLINGTDSFSLCMPPILIALFP